jgi:hypothetical protein
MAFQVRPVRSATVIIAPLVVGACPDSPTPCRTSETPSCSPSLCSYCVYELRMPGDVAYRRVAAARIAARFPRVFDMIAAGELHLTGALLVRT